MLRSLPWRLKHERTTITYRITARCSHRLVQNLTYLAPGVTGAVLLSVLAGAQKGIRLTRQTNRSRSEVKNVGNSPFSPFFSKSFTVVRCNCLKENPMENLASKSDSKQITETGGSTSDSTFWLRSAQKVFEHDWAFAKRALARSNDPDEVIRQIAQHRASDKPNPEYYPRLTVTKAAAELNNSSLANDKFRSEPEH
jgi:hypothetical protein